MHNENEVVYLPLDEIIPNRFQPRELFDEKALKELSGSIKEHGVIQPIIVRSIGTKYEIIAGERRYKAAAMAGLTKIPAIIRNLDDKESAKVALLENLQRKDLSAIEEARTYQKILELDQLTQEDLAKTMSKSQSAIANKLRLLSLPDEVQDALLREKISERHARSLLNVQDAKQQVELLNKIIETRMTVRELEQEIQKINHPEEEIIGNTAPQEVPQTSKFFNLDNLPPIPGVEPEMKGETSTPSALETPDLDAIRANSKDISEEYEIADLDALLKLTEPKVGVEEQKPADDSLDSPFRFIPNDSKEESDSIARLESLLKPPTVPIESNQNPTETLDFGTILTPQTENLFDSNVSSSKMEPMVEPLPESKKYIYNMNQAIGEVRNIVKVIENSGFKVDSEEMDLVQEYQIVIKISKDEPKNEE